jgi:hypothetical protein
MSAVVDAVSCVQQQTSQDLLELLDSMGRRTVPIYHTDNWYELRLSQVAQRTTTSANVIRYDSELTYDSGNTYDGRITAKYVRHPAPDGLEHIPLIMNRFTDPDLLWVPQLNFELTDTGLVFYTDPFSDARIVKQPVYLDGVVVDYTATLWIYRGQWDWDTIYQQFGYVLKLRMQSSTGYRDILNAAYDAMLSGGAGASLLQMLSAMTGIPLVRYADEVVSEITQDTGGQLVITDRSVYRLSITAELTVAVGDVLAYASSMTTALQVYELNRRPTLADIPAIALGSGYLTSCMYGDLLFPNKSVSLEVITDDVSGFTKVRWPLGGFPLDVDQFFDSLHERGVAESLRDLDECTDGELLERTGEITEFGSIGVSGYVRKATLAHLLDLRVTAVDEPTAAHLPTTINPFTFLVENILHKNTTIVVLRTAGFSTDGAGLQNLRMLQRILPPQSAVLLIIELDVPADTIAAANFTETIENWVGVEVQSDVITTSYIQDSGLTARIISGA